MTLKDILQTESLLLPVIFLYRKGLQWYAFEYSALRFCQDFALSPQIKKWNDNATEEEIVYASFPAPLLKTFLETSPHAHITPDEIAIPSDYPLTSTQLEQWKEQLPPTAVMA